MVKKYPLSLKSPLIPAGIISLFAFYTLSVLERQSLWHDEIYTLSFIRGFDIYLFKGSDLQSIDQLNVSWYRAILQKDAFWPQLYRNIVHEGHPPLYYLLLKLWTYIFGVTTAGLRSFSVFISCLSLFTAFRIGRIVSNEKAFLFPLLLAISPLFIYYAIEARSYALYILLSLLCFHFFLRLLIEFKRTTNYSPSNFAIFLTCGALLFYTHYYGVFFFAILALVLAYIYMQRKKYNYILLLSLPGILFLPWLSIIRQQTAAHDIHWTDGYLGFWLSVKAFVNGAISLITAPFQGWPVLEFWIPAIILLILTMNYCISQVHYFKKAVLTFFLIMLYGLSIIAFDKQLDHHTVAVPRYYIPLQFSLLFLIFYMSVNGRRKWLGSLLIGAWCITCLVLQDEFHQGSREPRQMYREAASYISQKYDPAEVDIVVSPAGPSAVALAYYLTKDFRICTLPAEQMCEEYNHSGKVLVEQRLGLASEPWMLACKSDTLSGRVVRFVGLDIINEK